MHKEKKIDCYAIKITAKENDEVIGRAWLYVLYNDLHHEPYGMLEDVFVEEKYRGRGLGTKLVQAAMEESKRTGCYKLIATSRNSQEKLHAWYEKLGFKNYGVEFRMDLV